MISTKLNRYRVGVAFASACLTFNVQAFAQDPIDPAIDPPADNDVTEPSADVSATASTEGSLTGAADSASGSVAATTAVETPEADEPSEAPPEEVIEKAERGAPMSAELPPTSTTATGTSVEREAAVTLIGLESLPGSAYPSAQVRGLKYGSLWRTFHGQQWPYMPKIGEKPGLRIGFSGYLWNDLSSARITPAESTGLNEQNRWLTQTRGIIRVTPTYNVDDGWFVQGNAEAVIQGDMRPDIVTGVLATTDDVWVRLGKWDVFDLTVGRFQAWEIGNHFGMGLDWATLERQGAWVTTGNVSKPTDGYGLTHFWDRQNYLLGTYALHVYPTKYLRGELLGHIGAGISRATNPYQMDIRPSAIFDIGILKVKAGWEYGTSTPQDSEGLTKDDKNGYGVAAQVVLAPYVEFGGSFSRGFQDVLDINGNVDFTNSNTLQTFGGFVNASPGHEPLVLGIGAFWNSQENLRWDPERGMVDTNDQQSMFAAVQYTLWDQFFMKFVLAHASNQVDNRDTGKYTNTSTSGRLRLELLY
jgi:hypothetical protein